MPATRITCRMHSSDGPSEQPRTHLWHDAIRADGQAAAQGVIPEILARFFAWGQTAAPALNTPVYKSKSTGLSLGRHLFVLEAPFKTKQVNDRVECASGHWWVFPNTPAQSLYLYMKHARAPSQLCVS